MAIPDGSGPAALVIASVASLGLAACNPDTFASGKDTATATITNDTAASVTLRLCSDNACEKDFHPRRYDLVAGDSVEVNVSKRGVPNVYLVLDFKGERTGCLPIVVDEPDEAWARVDVAVSTQLECSDDVPNAWPTS